MVIPGSVHAPSHEKRCLALFVGFLGSPGHNLIIISSIREPSVEKRNEKISEGFGTLVMRNNCLLSGPAALAQDGVRRDF